MTADSFTPLHARTTTNAVFLYLFFLQSCWPVPQLNLVLFSLCCNVAIFFTLLAVELSTTEHGYGQCSGQQHKHTEMPSALVWREEHRMYRRVQREASEYGK